MNEVFLKGVIVSADKPEHQAAENNHLVYQLRMTHRNRQGQLRHELYPINVWNRLADWAEKHITPGVPVVVKGYLTQRSHNGTIAVEITARQLVIQQTMPRAEEAPSALSNG